MKLRIEGINQGNEFEFPDITIEDEEVRLKAIINIKKEYKDCIDIKEVDELAAQEGAYAMLANILKRVDSSVTVEKIKSLKIKEQIKLSNALNEKVKEYIEDSDFFLQMKKKEQ